MELWKEVVDWRQADDFRVKTDFYEKCGKSLFYRRCYTFWHENLFANDSLTPRIQTSNPVTQDSLQKKTYAVETSWFPRIELSREWLQTGLKCLHSFHSFSSLCTLTSDADMIQRMKCDSLLKSPSWSTLFKTSCSLPLLTFFVSPLPAFYGLLKRVLLLLPSSTCPSLCYPCSLSSSLVPFFFLFQFLLLLEDCNVHVNCVLTTGHSTRKWLTYWTENFL